MGIEGKTTFVNGKIFTSDDRMPYADALTVAGGRIVAIGSEKDLPGDRGTVIDLKGRRVIPGFVDAHMHSVMLADCMKKITVMPPEICSIEELVQAIRERRAQQEAAARQEPAEQKLFL